MPVIPAFRKLKQEDLMFKAGLGDSKIVSQKKIRIIGRKDHKDQPPNCAKPLCFH
jgi:hypothetical protein